MWALLAAMSAVFLGFYDVFKKRSLLDNAVIPVLTLNCIFCSLFFVPLITGSMCGVIDTSSCLYIPSGGWIDHRYAFLKAVLVLSSWICGYIAIKRLPLTIVGPVNATRPVLTLLGAMMIFGERLNFFQWTGVCIAVLSFYMLGRSGEKEGIDFKHDKGILFLVVAAVIGAVCGLYDKYLLSPVASGGLGLDGFFVQGWYNFYQAVMMLAVLVFCHLFEKHKKAGLPSYNNRCEIVGPSHTAFHWKWSIPMISVCLTAGDMSYMHALTIPGAMISIVSMIRRSSVLVSFVFGAILFHEKNLKGKSLDLILVIISLLFLLAGTIFR
ncbi:MAG: DMT family transporter [Bacteroidales bacterium]|jgi:drug/metabolite transporter (DMT)-like permease|nr:DMT family transporter [Bacteroidales bacterium]MCI1785817.1 DMT family transporter [Bacteroidales bacterium]